MNGNDVQIGFEMSTVTLPMNRLVPTHPVTRTFKKTDKYRRIVASIREVGLVEPLAVTEPKDGPAGTFIVLDGHIRLEALREIGATEATCIVSKDDEAYTYNRHVNRLSSFQEHFMLAKALNSGVSEERLARALDIDVKRLREKCNLLRGICPEAVTLLRNRDVAASAIHYFRKVKSFRQIAMAEAMNSANNFSRSYAFALYAATPPNMLLNPEKPKDSEGVALADVARIEKEISVLERDVQQVKDDLARDSLNLAFVRAYLTKLLENNRVVRFLAQHHSEVLGQFQKIVETESLDA